MTPSAETIVVDRAHLEMLIGKGKINSLDALKLSPELNQLAAALQAKERAALDISKATGKLEVPAEDLIPLWVCARDLAWTTDDIANIYPAMNRVGAMLAARGRGEL
jgi:hypothetical protein